MRKQWIYMLLFALLGAGCVPKETPREPSMIVEAWIDAGGNPIVLLHKTYDLLEVPDSVEQLEQIIENQLIMWGKVVVSDGDTDIILTGRLDTLFMPPYTYSSVQMLGQVGKTYTLTATYKQLHATATTTIPPVATLDSIAVKLDAKGRAQTTAYMSHLPAEHAGYALFMRYDGERQFRLCPYGVFDNSHYEGDPFSIAVHAPFSGDTLSGPEQDSTRLVQVKIARLDEESYDFWSKYSSLSMTKGTFFVPVFENIQGNIKNGLGHFTGMGSTIYTISLTEDSTYVLN